MHKRTHLEAASRARAFTVIELLISIAVIAVLIGILVLGVRAAHRQVGSLMDSSGADQVFAGVKQFKQEVGFLPPLVKELESGTTYENAIVRAPLTAITWTNIVFAQPPSPPDPPRNAIAVYTRGADAEFFKATGPKYLGPTPANFFRDNRFSQLTLGYYIASQLEFAFNASLTDVPLDGINGPGMYKPEKAGVFDVPGSMRRPAADDRKRQGKTYGPYVEAGGKTIKVFTDTTSDAAGRDVTVRDRSNVPIRYYYWLPKSPQQANQDPDVAMEIPPLVGRVPNPAAGDAVVPDERNPKTNPLLRTATWAIVCAGPDKVFGDEPIDYIAQVLGKSPASTNQEITALRLLAAKDNIVRLGTED